jgi:hypothetical protein
LSNATLISCLAICFAAGDARSDALPDHSDGPLTGLFGFPGSIAGSRTLPRRAQEISLAVATASHNIDEMRGSESLRLDGETTRLAFAYRFAVSDRLELGVEMPYLWHQSGNLDSLIDGWHELFGLPRGPRAVRADDQLEFFYTDGQSNRVNLTRNTGGFGDLRLQAAWQLSAHGKRSSSLRISAKLPTGDSESLRGSGGTDLGVGIAGDADALWGRDTVSGFYRAHLTWLGRPDLLSDRVNDFVGQLSAGLGFRVHRNVDLRVQTRIRSAVYDSAIESLGKTSATLTAGADFRLSDRYRLALAIGEDIQPDSAPDVSFQIALRYQGR